MARHKILILLLLLGTGLFPQLGFSQSGRIAVLPMEDLSQGANGLNLALTSQVRDGMRDRGFTMVSREEIIAFMVKNRVRWLGYLGSSYVRRLHDELDVEYLVLGVVTQRRDKRPFALGLTLQVIRTKDARLLWAHNVELCGADEIGLLGLAQLRDMAELEAQVVEQALRTIPDDFQEYGRPLAVRDALESVVLGPEIVKPGDMIHCRLKLGGLPAELFKASVSIFVDERIIEAGYQKDEKSFVASWPAAARNESYPVTVAVSSPEAGEQQEVLVGSYVVDGQAPTLKLVLKGQELNGITVLQKRVTIMPRLKKPEPISRWLITVRDDKGAEVMSDDGRHTLPARFSWWGQAKNGALVADGFYNIGFTVWDRAGNSASTEESIQVIRQEPQMTLVMKEVGKSLALDLEYKGDIPLAYWRLQIHNERGDLLSESSGTEESRRLMLPLAMVAGQDISYQLSVQDMLGNRLQRHVAALVPVKEKETEAEAGLLTGGEDKKTALQEIWTQDF
ncbi:MAG: hypothetical protein RI601_07850 [Desulfurivibrionaceae bacterium]|nr:hypothetical protein [Desulfurivibrionaceae bacterium]